MLGELSLREGDLTAAQLLLRKAEALSKTYTANDKRKTLFTQRTLGTMASLAQVRGEWELMQSLLERLLKQQGDTPLALRMLAVAQFQQMTTRIFVAIECGDSDHFLAIRGAIRGVVQRQHDNTTTLSVNG